MSSNPAHPFDWLIATESLGMDTAKIKSVLFEKAGGIENAADELHERLVALSQVINYERKTPRIRAKLTARYGIRFNDTLLREVKQ